MREILLILEDELHEKFVGTLVARLAKDAGVSGFEARIRSATGGFPRLIGQLKDFMRECREGREFLPAGIVVAVDANCQGFNQRRKAVGDIAGELNDQLACAVPNPHLERWMLLDGAAFKKVVGKGCRAPDQKCEKDRYKKLLTKAVRDAGQPALLGGVEYAEEGHCQDL